MQTNDLSSVLILNRAAGSLMKKFRAYRLPLLSSILFGFLAYTFAFTNKLVNHDEVYTLFFKGGSVSLGRWGLDFIDRIFPDYSMPWIYGVITIILMACAVCVVIRLYRIESPVLQVLLSGVIVVFPSLIAIFSYMYLSSSYALSIFLAVCAAYLIDQKGVLRWGLAVVCLVASLSLYQAHVSVCASLLVLVLIRQLLRGEDVPAQIRKGLFFVTFLVVSLLLYYVATKIMQLWKNVGFNGYAVNSLNFDLRSFPTDIADAYGTYFQYIFQGHCGLVPNGFSRAVHLLCLVFSAVLLLCWALRQQGPRLGRFLLLAALIGIFPLASNCLHLFATRDSVHTLVAYGFVTIYVLVAVLVQECASPAQAKSLSMVLQSVSLNLITLCLGIVIIVNTYIANEAFLTLYLRYENAYAFYTSLIADLKMMPEFDEDSKLAVIGTFQEPAYYLEKFSFSDAITGIDGFLPDSYSKDRFLEYYLGFPIPFATEEELQQITASQEYAQMAVYPYYGSMRWFDNILVVKLS